MLDPDGHEGRALTEYHRQAQRFADIDARLDASEDHVSPTAVNTVRPIRDRDWALSQDELVAVCRQLPHRVEAQAEIDTNMHNTMIPPNHCPLMWIPIRTSEATWIRRHDNGEIERWTTDQACEYLATVFLNARPESSKSRANDTAQSSTTPTSSIPKCSANSSPEASLHGTCWLSWLRCSDKGIHPSSAHISAK